MAKVIKYEFLASEINRGAEEALDIEQIIRQKRFECETQDEFDANYPIAEKESIPGTIEVTGEFDPEPETPEITQEERIAELEEALAMLLNGVTE